MNRGEIWFAALDPVRGSEQAGTRPVLVIQRDSLNAFLRTVVVVPLTTNLKWERFPFCVRIPVGEGWLTADSIALCHQVRVVDKTRLFRLLGSVSEGTLTQVQDAVHDAIDQ